MNPKLRALLARVILVGGVAGAAAFIAERVPHDQTIAIRLADRQVSRVEAVVTQQGEAEPTSGFSQDFPEVSPRTVRYDFSAPNGTYIVVITLRERAAGDVNPNQPETTFERRVSLAGGEVTVSPD